MERRQRLIQLGSAAAFIAVCVVAVLVVVSQSGGGAGGDTKLEHLGLVKRQLRGIPQHGTLLGDPKAKVRVVEFGDLQCPVCKAFSFDVAPGLISGPVRHGRADYEFRNWTIIGPDSTDAAKASLAAAEQGRYWSFVELFYRNQGGENTGYVTDEFLRAIAKGARVPDLARWDRDRRSGRWGRQLRRIDTEARGLGFTGTPSVLVEGPAGKQALKAPSLEGIEGAIRAVQ
jgi:protein-disulfide isomerase